MKPIVKDLSKCLNLVKMVTKLGFVTKGSQMLSLCCKLHRFEHLEMEQNGVQRCRLMIVLQITNMDDRELDTPEVSIVVFPLKNTGVSVSGDHELDTPEVSLQLTMFWRLTARRE